MDMTGEGDYLNQYIDNVPSHVFIGKYSSVNSETRSAVTTLESALIIKENIFLHMGASLEVIV